jgi:hypothetical protein
MTDKINLVVGEWEVIYAGSQEYHYLSYMLYQEDINLYNNLERFLTKCIHKNIKIVDTEFIKLIKPYATHACRKYGKVKFFEGVKRLIYDIVDNPDKFEELYISNYKQVEVRFLSHESPSYTQGGIYK